MVEASSKVVSIEAFRARRAERGAGAQVLSPVGDRPELTARDIEHRERMLRFLRAEARAAIDAHVQGRLLL
jgi:hypothetical protein